VAAGLSAAMSNVFAFILTKSYIYLASFLQLGGVIILYGVIGILGVIFLYFNLPETEGKSLAEIEKFFNKEKRQRK
jgi:hypothetical protein